MRAAEKIQTEALNKFPEKWRFIKTSADLSISGLISACLCF